MSNQMGALSDEDVLSRIGLLGRRLAGPTADQADLRRGRAALLRQTAEARVVRRERPWALALVAVSAALLTVLAWFAWPRSVVGFDVSGAAVAEGGFVQAAPSGSATIAFDDGSAVELEPGTRVRVGERRAHGASVLLEQGRLTANIAAREGGADYVFHAGPYAVMVVGTSFDLTWDADRGHATLAMNEGTVVVTGPRLEGGLRVAAGQRVELGQAEVRVVDREASASGTPAAVTPTSSGPTETSTAAPSAEVPSAETAAPTARKLTWAERVADGDYEGVLAEVDARGEASVLGSASVGELMMVADAARYGGRPSLAVAALRAVRARFAGTPSAGSAAFLLGRMAEDGGRASEATGLYDAAIAEGSPFASEALGRSMLLAQRGDKARATALAERYLASHPKGAYAEAARAIVGR